MKNIIVTTPKSEMQNAAKEAKKCIEDGAGYYFRSVSKMPKDIVIGESKIYYIEDGYIRGYGVIIGISNGNGQKCSVGDKTWKGPYFIWMPACTWKWIKPIPMKGFQGFRYFNDKDVKVVGEWKDAKPVIHD